MFHTAVAEGQTVAFSGGFADHKQGDLTFFVEKHNKYATREASLRDSKTSLSVRNPLRIKFGISPLMYESDESHHRDQTHFSTSDNGNS
jgi:hypothetical protein